MEGRHLRTGGCSQGEAYSDEVQVGEGSGKMTADLVVGIMAEAIKVTLLVSAPVLLVGLVVGVVISLFQAVTQVQEMTLVFVPKIIAVLVALVAALPWMLNLLVSFTQNLYLSLPNYIG